MKTEPSAAPTALYAARRHGVFAPAHSGHDRLGQGKASPATPGCRVKARQRPARERIPIPPPCGYKPISSAGKPARGAGARRSVQGEVLLQQFFLTTRHFLQKSAPVLPSLRRVSIKGAHSCLVSSSPFTNPPCTFWSCPVPPSSGPGTQ